MLDLEVRRLIMEDRIATLRRSARPRKRREPTRVESPDIELRMCKPADDPEIDRLAALSEVPVPYGRLVVALLDGKLVAALPLNGDPVIRDPFVKTEQLREPVSRPTLVPRLLRRHA